MLLVLAGRAAFRLLLWAAGPVLLAAWGRAGFAPYAAAMGVCTALIVVVAAGPEKAALKLVPRARRTRADLVGTLRTSCAAIPLPPFAVAAALSAAAPGSDAALFATAATYCAGLGSAMVLAALCRAQDRPRRDPAAFGCIAAGTAVLLAAASAAGLGPAGYLWCQVALTLAVAAALWRGLRPAERGSGRGRGRRLLAGSAMLMGLPEVLTALATSGVYVELTLTSHAVQAADLYLVLQGWSLLVSATYLLQRLFQPRLSVRLARDRSADAADRARGMMRNVVVGGTVWLAVVAVVLANVPADRSPALLVAVPAVLCVSRAPLYVLMSQASLLLEHTDAAGLRASTWSNAIGVACAVAAGAALAPALGAVGAVVALAVREPVTGLVLLRLRPQSGRRTARIRVDH